MSRSKGQSFFREPHGTARKRGRAGPRVEVAPPDEQPVGVAAPARPAANRDSAGRFVAGHGTKALARKGGKAAGESKQLARLLGLQDLDDDHPYAPYARLAREWRDAQMVELSATVGGGQISPGVASIISTAALQMAASRWASDQGATELDAKALLEFSKLGDASRQNILAAHQLAAIEAKSRPPAPIDWSALTGGSK